MSRYRLETSTNTWGPHTIYETGGREHSFDELQDALDFFAYLQLAETVEHLGETDAKRLDTLRILIGELRKALTKSSPWDRQRVLAIIVTMVGEVERAV